MDQRGSHARKFQEWTTSLPGDVQTTFELLSSEAVAPPGKRFLAAALSYIVTQLDLIPDHEQAGAIDDAFVVRVAHGLAAEHAGKAGTQESAFMARMTNEEDAIRHYTGDALFARLRRYVVELADKTVRGRNTDAILNDAKTRADLKKEIDQTLKKLRPPHALDDAEAEQIEVQVKTWLEMKLGKGA
jgi:uncharacterized membrane protein YkvA (DUF1232 family)